MYKATHCYQGQQEHILSFSAGETLCILEKNNESWWLASNSQGKVGYVPTTYVKKDQDDSDDIVLQSVNSAIAETIASAKGGEFTPKQKALLKKLVTHKESIINEAKKTRQPSTKRRAPPPPPPNSHSDNTANTAEPTVIAATSIAAKEDVLSATSPTEPKLPPALPKRVESLPAEETDHDSVQTSSLHDVPDDLGSELLQSLQITSNISENKSRNSLKTLLHILKSRIPSLEKTFNQILETVPPENELESDRLGLSLANLKEIKDDAQQRNWAIEDDEEKISAILEEILKELATIEKEISIKVLSHDQHSPLHTLVDYHQMETRVALRLIILQIFGVICSLSKSLVSSLLSTVLPLELSMDVMNHTQDTHRTCYSALVMTMLFSTAEPIPVGHYGRLNKAFVDFLIKYIENEIEDTEQDEQVVDTFVNVLLSYNLHFVVPADNIVMQAISDRGTCTLLSEKIMMLINRGDDPVAMEEHWVASNDGRPPPSVLKFLQDVFSQHQTSSFLYTNDMNVLLDIITRNLTDLSSGDKLRTEYLDLLLNIVTNTSYSETRHRAADLGQSLNRISAEDEPKDSEEKQTLEFDKHIVDKIMENFGHFFTS